MFEKNITINHFISTKAGLPSHAEGHARKLLTEEMIPRQEASVAKYGGQRDAIHLTNPQTAVKYLRDNDGNVPFGFD